MKNSMKLIAALFIFCTALSGVSFAESCGVDKEDLAEAKAFSHAQISLVEAITIAEKKTGAKAISAEFEDEDNGYVYSVELLKPDGSELEAEINVQTGAVIKIEDE